MLAAEEKKTPNFLFTELLMQVYLLLPKTATELNMSFQKTLAIFLCIIYQKFKSLVPPSCYNL